MPARADHPGKAWWYQHECSPNDCFELHNPNLPAKRTLNTEEHNAAIIAQHIRKQQEHFSKGVLSAAKKFERDAKAAKAKER